MNIFTSDEVDRMGKEASLFQGGRLEKFVDSWEKLTSDPEILQIFKGLCLESDCPATEIAQVSASQACLHEAERSVIDMEIQKLYNKGVISKCTPQAHQFVSPVFVRPKKDGTQNDSQP